MVDYYIILNMIGSLGIFMQTLIFVKRTNNVIFKSSNHVYDGWPQTSREIKVYISCLSPECSPRNMPRHSAMSKEMPWYLKNPSAYLYFFIFRYLYKCWERNISFTFVWFLLLHSNYFLLLFDEKIELNRQVTSYSSIS